MGLGKDPDALVVPKIDGEPHGPRTFSKSFSRLVKAVGGRPVTFHGLRHIHISRLLIDRHGGEAPIHVAMRDDELLEAGDMNGVSAWKRIIRTIEVLLAKERP